jgi:hypothetical protein
MPITRIKNITHKTINKRVSPSISNLLQIVKQMSCCSSNPLNGLPLGGNTEGGRLQREQAACAKKHVDNGPVTAYCCSPYKETVQAPITPTSGSRTDDLALGCNQKQGVTIARVQALLATVGTRYKSGTERVMSIQQQVIACSATNGIPIPIIIEQCPPLPAPPGPPARICVLTKNQKY